MNIKVSKVKTINPQSPKCRCGKCKNKMVIVEMDKTNIDFTPNILEWIPTERDMEQIIDAVEKAFQFNLKYDNFCYKA